MSLRLESGENNQLLVSAIIKDDQAKTVAILERNEWTSAGHPQAWDRNYTNDTLEIIGPNDSVVLQIRLLPDRIQIQGESWDSPERGVRITRFHDPDSNQSGGAIIYLVKGQDACNNRLPIKPIFRYPSRLHFHELDNKSPPSELPKMAEHSELWNCNTKILVFPPGNYGLAPK